MFWLVAIPAAGALIAFWLLLRSRNMHLWFFSYLRHRHGGRRAPDGVRHVYVCVADHYEPYFGGASREQAHALVERWVAGYREIAARHRDSDGRPPQHSYFYPVEEYDEWVLDRLGEICAEGLGDVDIHLHHDDDTAENLACTLDEFKRLLHRRHGLLRRDARGEIVYGFIHGNWALDNSRPDGKWCGVDNELDVLVDTGCVYDMTMPSAPSDTQTSIINSIYFAREDGAAKSHDRGRPARVGEWGDERDLLMIQGPLTLNWRNRKLGILPRIENGELSADTPPSAARIELWERCGICVLGAEDHVFIKLYTHGLQEKNLAMFFERGGFDTLFGSLESRFRDDARYCLHYLTAWEMYEAVVALCDGREPDVADRARSA